MYRYADKWTMTDGERSLLRVVNDWTNMTGKMNYV